MTTSKYPPRHTPLMTSSGPAHFEARSTEGKILVYHVRKEFRRKEWNARFGSNAGKGVFVFYQWNECSLLDDKGKPLKKVKLSKIPDYIPPPKEELPTPDERVGEVWTSRRAECDYEIVAVNGPEATLMEITDPSYKRKVILAKLEKYYDRKS